MQMGGLFTEHLYRIKVKGMGDTISLFPFGDVHYGAPLFSESTWVESLREWKSAENPYFLGMGDYMDLFAASNRDALMRASLHESATAQVEDMQTRLVEAFADEIAFMKGRTIGLMEGNHHGTYLNGTTTTQKLCEKMGTKYLGCSTYIMLSIEFPRTDKSLPVVIWAHHGQGAAQTKGGSLNRVEKMMSSADADIYLMGHDHERGAIKDMRFYLKRQPNGTVVTKEKQRIYGRTGSYLLAYKDGKASYVADKALRPKVLGHIRIDITPRQDRDKGMHFDMRVSQ